MDESRFDDLSKRLAAPLARRRMLKGLGGGLVAGLLVRAGLGPAAAASCPATVRCGHGPTAVCCQHAADVCSRGAICQSATLACPVGGDVSRPSYRCTDTGGFACD